MAEVDARLKGRFATSETLFERAERVIPGGVNSPVRAFRGVGGTPLFIESAQGCFLRDADHRSYIDYVGSWGPMILGHAREEIVAAIQAAAGRGTSFGAPTELEVELAELVARLIPSIEKLRLTSSGTEATMSALRLARGFTSRSKILKFEGCYHGHADSLLVRAGSGVATLGLPDSPGVLPQLAEATITAPFNDLHALETIFAETGGEIAAVIIEPVPGNMGCIVPAEGYLESVRRVTREYGAVLIFDEVMTGFRVGIGGAQGRFGVEPDLTCLGKIIGGGLPVGAFGGRREIMDQLAPIGPVYQAGTLSGNPLAVTAGLTCLRLIEQLNPYPELERRTRILVDGLKQGAERCGIEVHFNQVGSMFTGFFAAGPVVDWASASKADRSRYAAYFHGLLDEGVYLAPSQFEACFVSTSHSEEVIETTIAAAAKVMKTLK
jgi:glutamate-1-semialdehyde 2,1-aminomutase